MRAPQTLDLHRAPAWPDVGYPKHVVCGNCRFDNVTLSEATDRIADLIGRRSSSMVVTPNVDHLVRMQSDRSYADLVRRADLVLVDGQPVVWASRLLGTPLKERVAGSDLTPLLCERAAETGWRLFFLGGEPARDGQPDAATAAQKVLLERHPNLQIVGAYCPPFGFEKSDDENRRIVDMIREAAPDIVLVGLGSPKQELWIDRHMHEYGAPVSIGVGVSFSFISGQIRRAPVRLRRLGMEWAWRLSCEPRRLWRRYLLRGSRFLPIVMRDLWRQRRELSSRSRPATSPAAAELSAPKLPPGTPAGEAPVLASQRQAS